MQWFGKSRKPWLNCLAGLFMATENPPAAGHSGGLGDWSD